MDPLPTVTVLIAARPEQAAIQAVTAGRRLDYPPDRLEILVARGKQPSAQRNEGLRAAQGDLIYFLDDDSVPEPGSLRRAVRHFIDPKVQMVGGPNVCPADAPWIERVFALVLGSWLAFGPSRARYVPVGRLRQSSEKELILCNLLARRAALLELGGFNEALYPNEENALMDELQKRGGILLYDPELAVHRRPRSSVRAFARMLLTYGRGRAEQFRLHPTAGSALNFVPPLFVVYVLALSFTPMLPAVLRLWLLLPLGGYLLAVAVQVLRLAVQANPIKAFAAAPFITLTHLLYGIGFWRGLFTSLTPSGTKPRPAVAVENAGLGMHPYGQTGNSR